MDSDIDGDELFFELKIVRKRLPKETKRAIEVLDYLKMMDSCFPNVWIAYRILLTIPVTVASVEIVGIQMNEKLCPSSKRHVAWFISFRTDVSV